MHATRPALAALTALLLGACSPAAPTDLPEAPATEALPPTGLPEPATIAAPEGALSPEEVAQTIFQAWVQGNRAAAQEITDSSALADLDTVFAQPFDPTANWAYDHCEGTAGSTFCTWHSNTATMIVQVRSAEPPPVVIDIRLESAAAP